MKPIVMTEELFFKLKKDFTYKQAMEILEQINNAINLGNPKNALELIKHLFIDKLKYSFDFDLCWDVMGEIKKQAYRYSTIYDIESDNEIETLKLSSYASIEELYSFVSKLVKVYAEAAYQKGQGLGYITQEAIRYMKNNYVNQISLTDIAAHINVAPEHLSRIFNKETGTSIPTYITQLRIESAKKLLLNSNYKLETISNMVGIENTRYFGQLFKKLVGKTPNEFRMK